MGFTSALETAQRVKAGSLRAADHVAEVLAGIEARNPECNAFIEVTAARALAEARAVDASRAAGRDPGPLAGVPFAVKNLYDVRGLPTLAGSKINRDLPPAGADATLVQRLNAAGAVLVGTLNMDEYAYGFSTENTHYGATRNPHDRTRVAGGSSGGSAAAVVAGLVPLTLGSDTNGSIRVPSSLCGNFGLKPTYGRLSRAGSFPFVASLDHLGPFCRSVGDLAAAYDVMQGADPADPVCRPGPVESVSGALAEGIGGLRIACAAGYFEQSAEPGVVQLVRRAAEALGATACVEIPDAALARAAAFIITAVEGSQLHLPNLRKRAEDFEPLIRDRLLANTVIPSAWYVQAQRFRRRFHRQVMALFEKVDVILAPATPRPAVKIGQESMSVRGVEMLARPNMGLMTQPISFIGLPVITVPIGMYGDLPDLERPMPVGMQVIAAPWNEKLCFRVAAELEKLGVSKFIPPEEFA